MACSGMSVAGPAGLAQCTCVMWLPLCTLQPLLPLVFQPSACAIPTTISGGACPVLPPVLCLSPALLPWAGHVRR